MSESKDRFSGRTQILSQRDLGNLQKEWGPKTRGPRSSLYRDKLNDFLNSSGMAMKIEHATIGEQAGFLGLIYPAKKGGKALFTGKITIQTRREEDLEKDESGKNKLDKKGKPRHLVTLLFTKTKKG